MKKIKLALGLLLAIAMLNSCSEETVEPMPTSTLELTIKNELGNLIPGATVKLYSNETDWRNQTNQIGSTKITGSDGIVNFTNIDDIKYYWYVEKDCENNVNGAVTTVTPLSNTLKNRLDVILKQTGNIRFQNNSTNPYRVYINEAESFDMPGNTFLVRSSVNTGNYSIRVLQISGFAFTPTEETYTGNVGCGQTLNVTFP